jgi:hypothetical protein
MIWPRQESNDLVRAFAPIASGFVCPRFCSTRRLTQQPLVEQDSRPDQGNDGGGKKQEPAPVLRGMPKHLDEVTPVQVRNDADDGIPDTAAYGDDGEVFAQVIFRSARGCEYQACREKVGTGELSRIVRKKSPNAPINSKESSAFSLISAVSPFISTCRAKGL